MKKSTKRQKKQEKRRKREQRREERRQADAHAAAPEPAWKELIAPGLGAELSLFVELASFFGDSSLSDAGFARRDVHALLLEDGPTDPRGARRALLERLARPEALDRSLAVLGSDEAREDLLDRPFPGEERAYAAGLAALRDGRDRGAGPDHPCWEVLLSLGLLWALRDGQLVASLLREASPPLDRAGALEGIAGAFERSRADPRLAATLAEQGIRAEDAPDLAATLVDELWASNAPLPCVFDFEDGLHLWRVAALARRSLRSLPPERARLRPELAGLCEEAHRRAVTPALVDELVHRNLHSLSTARGHARHAHGCDHAGEEIDRRVRATSLGFLLAPPERNAFLRRCHAEALHAAAVWADDPTERDLCMDLMEEPEQPGLLEALEARLFSRRDRIRARRVGRYIEVLRREHDRFRAWPPGPPGPPD